MKYFWHRADQYRKVVNLKHKESKTESFNCHWWAGWRTREIFRHGWQTWKSQNFHWKCFSFYQVSHHCAIYLIITWKILMHGYLFSLENTVLMDWIWIGSFLDSMMDTAYKIKKISRFYSKYFLIEKKKMNFPPVFLIVRKCELNFIKTDLF